MPGFSIEDYLEEIVQEVEKRQQETGDILVKQENHKELIRRVIGEKLNKPQPVVPPASPLPVVPVTPLPNQISDIQGDMGEKSYEKPELKPKVDELIEVAFERDLDTAIDKVKVENNPALLDAFHDALVDKLYDNLVQSGRLKQLQ